MRRRHDDILRTVREQGVRRRTDRATRVDHVVDQHTHPALDVTHDLVHRDLVRHVLVTPLVHDRQRRVQPVAPTVGDPHPTRVRRHDRQLGPVDLRTHVVRQDRQREQVVHRTVEEALDLVRVQIHREDPVRTRRLHQIRDQPRRDRLTALVLLVLTGIPVERHDHRDRTGRRALQRVQHDQLLHDPLVDRSRVALDQEAVRATCRLLEPHIDLTVGEIERLRRHETDSQLMGDLLGQLGVGAAGEEHQFLLAGRLDPGHSTVSSDVFLAPHA